jgi:CheY-like chemotaxis protein
MAKRFGRGTQPGRRFIAERGMYAVDDQRLDRLTGLGEALREEARVLHGVASGRADEHERGIGVGKEVVDDLGAHPKAFFHPLEGPEERDDVLDHLVAADAKWVRDQVRAAFMGRGQNVVEVTRGQDVRDTFAEVDADLVVLDMQIGNMGGVAVAIDLRLEESGGRLDRANILLLLDREADEFIARRADVDLMLVKPVDAGVLRRAAKQLLPAAS